MGRGKGENLPLFSIFPSRHSLRASVFPSPPASELPAYVQLACGQSSGTKATSPEEIRLEYVYCFLHHYSDQTTGYI